MFILKSISKIESVNITRIRQSKMSLDYIMYIFDKYAEELNDLFDDGLTIKYRCENGPTFKILYDPDVEKEELIREIPDEWKELAERGEIRLIIKKFTKDCDEYKEAMRILSTPRMIALREKTMKQLSELK
jgi:hypothetical protein